MSKRVLSPSHLDSASKKMRNTAKFLPNRIATAEAAARVDADPPLGKLLKALHNSVKTVPKGEAIVYWMRMADLRGNFTSSDTRGSIFYLSISRRQPCTVSGVQTCQARTNSVAGSFCHQPAGLSSSRQKCKKNRFHSQKFIFNQGLLLTCLGYPLS